MGRRLGVVLVARRCSWPSSRPRTRTRPTRGPRGSGPSPARSCARSIRRRRASAPGISVPTSRLPTGTPVRAAGPGIVSFAGTRREVAARRGRARGQPAHLVLVSRDDRGAPRPVGRSRSRSSARPADIGQGHDGSVLHFALRTGDTYVDPMVLFRPVDLVAVVHLSPTSEPPHPVDVAQRAARAARRTRARLRRGRPRGRAAASCSRVARHVRSQSGGGDVSRSRPQSMRGTAALRLAALRPARAARQR